MLTFKIVPFGECFQMFLCHGRLLVNDHFIVVHRGFWGFPTVRCFGPLFSILFYVICVEQVLTSILCTILLFAHFCSFRK